MPSFYSIIKSYDYIDLEKSFFWVLILISVTLILTLLSNQALLVGADELSGRQGGNAAISTISFGHFGTTIIVLGVYMFTQRKVNLLLKIFVVFLILLGFFAMIRSGRSRTGLGLRSCSLFLVVF